MGAGRSEGVGAGEANFGLETGSGIRWKLTPVSALGC